MFSQEGYYYRLIIKPEFTGDFGRIIELGKTDKHADAKILRKGQNLAEGLCLGRTLYGPFSERVLAENDRKHSLVAV